MLGAPCQSLVSTWTTSSGVASLQRAGGSIAVGLAHCSTLLFPDSDVSSPLSELPIQGASAAVSSDGAVLLGWTEASRLLLVQLAAERNPSSTFVELGDGPNSAPVGAIAAQGAAGVFAVARGSFIHIVDRSGAELRRLGPLEAPATQLAWAGAGGDTLIAATLSGTLCLWSAGGAQEGALLPATSPAAPYLRVSASSSSQQLAASTAGGEVHCWDLDSLLSGADTTPLRLVEFESQPTCLDWDTSGRLLATADGADCAVWDLSDPSGAERSCSMVCCGHEPRTHITAVSFQPDGPLLATGGSGGKVAVFDCQQFRRGGVLGPAILTTLDQAEDAVTALLWLPGGRLLVGSASGRLFTLNMLQQQPPPAPAGPLSPGGCEAAALAGTLADLTVTDSGSSMPASMEAGPSLSPSAAAAEVPASSAAVQAAVQAATAAAAAALARPGSRSPPADSLSTGSSNQAGPSTPRAAAGAGQDPSAVQYELAGCSLPPEQQPPALPPHPYSHQQQQPPYSPHQQQHLPPPYPGQQQLPMAHSRQNSSSSGGSGQRRPRGARGSGGGSRSGAGRDGGGPGGGPGGQHGFSASLMSQIQAIRDNPPQGGARSDQQPQLSGWGLGSPSGAQVPWMMSGGGRGGGGGMAGGGAVPGIPPGSGAAGFAPGGPVGFTQFQSPQAAMFQRMGGMIPGMPQSPGGNMGGGSYGREGPLHSSGSSFGPGGQPMPHSPHMYPGGSSYGAPGGYMPGPMGSAQQQQQQQMYMAAAAGSMGQQPMMAAHWVMPYMQQVQQWAGTAPGYMVYQHGAAVPTGASASGPPPARMGGGAGPPGAYPGVMMGVAPHMPGMGGGSGTLSPMNSGHWSGGGGRGGGDPLSPRQSSSGGGSMGPPSTLQPQQPRQYQQHQQQQQQRRAEAAAAAAAAAARQGSLGSDEVAAADAAASDAAAAVAAAKANNLAGGTHVRPSGSSGGSAGEVLSQQDHPAGAGPGGQAEWDGNAAGTTAVQGSAAEEKEAAEKEQLQQRLQEEDNNDADGRRQQVAAAAQGGNNDGGDGADGGGSQPPAEQEQQQALAARSQVEARARAGQLQGGGLAALEGMASTDLNNALNNTDAGGMPHASASGRAVSCSEDASSLHDGADGAEGVTTVYVGNLPGTVDEYMLLCAFAPFGPITHVQVIKEKGSNLSRGYGFVSYAHPVYATVAMQQMNQQVLFGPFAGQRIKVAPSKRR